MRARGFTLIELAIVITIIGLLLSAFTAGWKVYQKQRERDINNAAIAQITAALNRFYGEHNYFPCPAGPKYPVGAAFRGIELRESVVPPDATTGLARCTVGPAAAGVLRVDGHRVDPVTRLEPNTIATQVYAAAADPVLTDTDTTAFIGAIPYVTLGLSEKYTYDAYGMKLTYAVSSNAAHLDTFDPNKGNITVQRFNFSHIGPTATAKTVATDNESVSFVVYSGGPDRRGVYTRDGTIATTCPAVIQADADFATRENCDNDALFLRTFNTNGELGLNAAAPAYYFDDIIANQRGSDSSIWESVPGSSTGDVRNVNLGNIGVGTNPHTAIRLDVAGNTRADKIITNKLCTSSLVSGTTVLSGAAAADKCFDPAALAGDPNAATGGMKCPGGQVLTTIGFGVYTTAGGLKYDCQTPSMNLWGIAAQACPAGKFVTGLKTNLSGAPVICCTGDPCP